MHFKASVISNAHFVLYFLNYDHVESYKVSCVLMRARAFIFTQKYNFISSWITN